jgi:hypothetical protein
VKRCLPFVALVVLLLSACETQRERVERTKYVIQGVDWVAIAGIGGSPEMKQIVTKSLAEIGIPCRCWGSVVYTVDVPEADYVRAIKQLKHEPELKGKWIRFI